jgi:mono/diheme cytochrome c family protein
VGATDLTDPEWKNRVDDETILNSITHGRGLRPGFNKKLTNEQIALLPAYVHSFNRSVVLRRRAITEQSSAKFLTYFLYGVSFRRSSS